MADCDCMADADREWLKTLLPDATETEVDMFLEKVAQIWSDPYFTDLRVADEVARNRALAMIEDLRL